MEIYRSREKVRMEIERTKQRGREKMSNKRQK